jgi:hypothetical protein
VKVVVCHLSVIRMPSVPTIPGISPVHVMQDTKETASLVQVDKY